MNFSYYDKNNKKVDFDINIGSKWSQIKTDNSFLNTIFTKIDNGDDIIQENEFTLLKNLLPTADKLNSKNLDIESLKEESLLQVNPEDYSVESLKKRYPESKYIIKTSNSLNKDIEIIEKSTNQAVLKIYNDKNGFYITEYSNNKETGFKNYNKQGIIRFYDEQGKDRKYPIAEIINKDICAKNKYKLPTTGKDLEKHIKMLDSDNVYDIFLQYKKMYGEDIIEAINDEFGLDKNLKNKLINHVQKCLEKHFGYQSNFLNNNSQISNKWHKGDSYSVDNRNDIITIKNKKTGKTRTINLNKLVENLDFVGRAATKAHISKLPGEILMDLAIESIKFKKVNWLEKTFAYENVAACYDILTNNITLGFNKDSYDISDKLVHELGHAVDHQGKHLNRSTVDNNELFVETFKKELENYIKAGEKQYDWGDKSFGNTYIRKGGGENCSNYASVSEEECFAEIYQLLTTGECASAEMLEDFFPETIKVAEKILNDIRNLPDDTRNCDMV